MSFIKSGMSASLVILVVFWIAYYYLITQVKKGKGPEIRRIAAVDALEEYVGRAIEMGRPMHYTTGQIAEADNPRFANVLSSLKILGYVAELCARKGADLIVSVTAQTVFPMAQSIVRSAFIKEGVPEKFNAETVQYMGGQEITRQIGNMERYNIATNVYIGDIGGSCWIVCEAAARIGATQIAGTPNDSNMVVLAITSDYTLLGDEQYTAGAILSESPADIASVWVSDIFKILCIGVIILITISYAAGNNWLISLLNL
jgi:hypothetical protein